ncbi:MAG: hypothetical protein P8L38_04685 [Gammaproteobacteria bacterium]|nr:hypothetical protein [Gammaproteobacteria bacterium]
MYKFIKLFFTTLVLSFSINIVVHADTLSDAIDAEGCADSDTAACAGECTQTSNVITIATTGNDAGGVTDADSGNLKNYCNEKPDEYRITFYKAGLCKTDILDANATSNPTAAPNCYNFFVDSDGKAISLQHDTDSGAITQSESLISGALNFQLGTYNYAYVIVDNHLEIKHEQTFSKAMKGYHVNGASFSSGVTCWTNGVVTTYTNATDAQRGYTATQVKSYGEDSSATDSIAMTCGDTVDATPVFNTEIIENMADDPGDENANFEAIFGSTYQSIPGSSDKGAGKLLQDDDLTTATNHLNAARIFYPIQLSNPIIVSPDTTTFEMSFGISGSVSIDFTTDGSDNLINLKAGADPFTMKFTSN